MKDGAKEFAPSSPLFSHSIDKVMRELEGVFKVLARNLPGSQIVPPDPDPRQPGYYVIALSIPRLENKGFMYPLHLVFVSFPSFKPARSVQVARAVVVGSSPRPFVAREFLREWTSLGRGGAIVYEGDVTPHSIRTAGQQAVLRFLHRRREIMEWYTSSLSKQPLAVWPIDPNFTPRVCARCLVPLGHGSPCPYCRAEAPRSAPSKSGR